MAAVSPAVPSLEPQRLVLLGLKRLSRKQFFYLMLRRYKGF
jgi:hypothetical protein